MSWQKLILQANAKVEEELSELLTEAGALAVTLEDAGDEPVLEPAAGTTPLWQDIVISALFDSEADLQQVLSYLQDHLTYPLINQRIEIVEEQDWQRVCQDAFKPICFANRLWIYPSWSEIPDTQLPHLMLDPGLAFGTGSHPTTALCLEWLAEHLHAGQTVIDYGCGSGILAIAALKLGAKHVIAIDNDPQALTATLENSQRNHINPEQLSIYLPNQTPSTQVDVVVANILANPLIELAPKIAALIKTQGNLVLSGILIAQSNDVIAAYSPWFSDFQIETKEDWVRISAKKINN